MIEKKEKDKLKHRTRDGTYYISFWVKDANGQRIQKYHQDKA